MTNGNCSEKLWIVVLIRWHPGFRPAVRLHMCVLQESAQAKELAAVGEERHLGRLLQSGSDRDASAHRGGALLCGHGLLRLVYKVTRLGLRSWTRDNQCAQTSWTPPPTLLLQGGCGVRFIGSPRWGSVTWCRSFQHPPATPAFPEQKGNLGVRLFLVFLSSLSFSILHPGGAQ